MILSVVRPCSPNRQQSARNICPFHRNCMSRIEAALSEINVIATELQKSYVGRDSTIR